MDGEAAMEAGSEVWREVSVWAMHASPIHAPTSRACYFWAMRILFFFPALILSVVLNAQQWNWAVDAGGGGNTDFCFGIATDSQGNAYWVGSVSGTADFGCGTLSPGSHVAGFIAKVDPDGACQWVRGITTAFYDAWVYGIAIDAQDRIYITGSCKGTTTFGNGVVLSGSGSTDDWFTARYDTSGNCIWGRSIANSSSTSEGHGIAVDAQGFVYNTGFAGGSGYTFAPITVNTGSSARQAVIVKYDSTGTALWAKATTGTTGRKSARSISVVGDRLFITGQNYYSISAFDGIPIATSDSWAEAYVLACDLDGHGLWAKSYGGGDNEGYGVSADTLGNVFVVGRMWGNLFLPDDTLTSTSSNDDILLMGFDRDGNYRWAKSTGSTQRDLSWGVTTDGMGNAYVASQFNNAIDFFGTSLTALGSEDILISKVKADGDVVWVQRPSGVQRDIPLCIHRQAAAPHKLYFGGYFWGAITYGSTTIDDVSNGDAMLVSGIDTTFDVSLYASRVCPGSCDGEAIAFTNGVEPFTYLWSTGAITSAITGLCSGEYIVEVTDAEGSVEVDTVHVTEHEVVELSIQQYGDSLWVDGAGSEWSWQLDGFTVSAGQPYHIALASGTYMVQFVDEHGCLNGTGTITIVLNVGMEEQSPNTLRVWPNPAHGTLYLELMNDVPLQTELLNSVGQRVRSLVLQPGMNTVDLKGFGTGLYVLLLEDGRTVRVVVQ